MKKSCDMFYSWCRWNSVIGMRINCFDNCSEHIYLHKYVAGERKRGIVSVLVHYCQDVYTPILVAPVQSSSLFTFLKSRYL